MTQVLPHVLIPMILSNVLHMIIVKNNYFSAFAKPIATALFGKNKTWRGFVIVPFLNAFFLLLLNATLPMFSMLEALKIGFLIGLIYMIMELPNSLLKRQTGIPAGQKATKNAWAFMIFDKVDSSLGVALACMMYFNWSWLVTLSFFAIAVGTHVFFSWLLVFFKIKKRF